jgi:uncharacterized protein (TIGR02145 family)
MMRNRTSIGLLWLLLLLFSNDTMSQWLLPDTVCTGTTNRKYYVNGWPGSTYTWTVQGGTVAPPGTTDTISVDWTNVPPGVYSITVTEHAQNGCSGDPFLSHVHVIESPYVTYTQCLDTVTTTNAKPIKLKGGIPPGGTYTGSGVSNGYFYPSIAGPGVHPVTYSFTNVYGCSSNASSKIHCFSPPVFSCGQPFSDIRDGTIYPTIQIGLQCWMAKNLNYGSSTSSYLLQFDNCSAEKYCYNDNLMKCDSLGGLYQWNEMMQYSETPLVQGLCPPGWHIPDENEWTQLFNNFGGNGFSGDPLRYDGSSGFNALLAGTNFGNKEFDFKNFSEFYWSSTSRGNYKSWAHAINSINHGVSYYPSLRNNAFSVRCLKD